MPIFLLTEDVRLFPRPQLAEPEGVLAVGGDLSVERLLQAYLQGIFPWYQEDQPILWWSPDPRLVLFPHKVKISRSLRKTLKKKKFDVRVNTVFPLVIDACGSLREQKSGTWITPAMKKAYIELHERGYAHSIESWYEGELVGGLYGIAIGKCFFGESMFTTQTDASKVAFITLVQKMQAQEALLIDCQVKTAHLMSLGAEEISRERYLELLRQGTSGIAEKMMNI